MNNFSAINNSADMPRTQPLFRSGAKHGFLKTLMWLGLAIGTGGAIAYYAWYEPMQTEVQMSKTHQAELDKIKQELTFLRDAYGELLQKQTTSPESLMAKIEALEKKLLSGSPANAGATPAYVNQLITLITLKDINHKIEKGISFTEDLKVLENTPVPNNIGLAQLKTESDKRFATLSDLQTHFGVFETIAETNKETTEDKSLITQMGDFLKITKEEETEGDTQINKALLDAQVDLNSGDVQSAYQLLRATFPETNEGTEVWFTLAESYLEGTKLRAQIDVWAGSLFSRFPADETE